MALKVAAPAPETTQDFPQLKDWVGRVIILEPMEEKVIATRHTPTSNVTECIAWAWSETGRVVEEIGNVSVFWGAIRAQLHEALATKDQVVGRLMLHGRRYELDPIDDSMAAEISKKFF